MKYETIALLVSTLALAAAALLAGCSPLSDSASSESAASLPTLSFYADWSVAQSGALVGGSQAAIHYDVARLPRCRVTTDGVQAWAITGYFSVDGYPAQQIWTPATNQPDGSVFRVPFGHGLGMWFYNSDDGGCTAWDSNYGRNFAFAIDAPPEPVIHFRSDFVIGVDRVLQAGADFLVDYDLHRLGCRADYNGLQTWDVKIDYRFDGGAVATQSLTESPSESIRLQAPARIHAPDGARSLEMWFESSDRTGCHQWDSDYGRNYQFTL
jgi:hypothetical protein